ncbi:ATPase [Sphingomonas panacis]|uniref:ATPase n=1 Tax=Sphingomonas panacis TaxID=1560345 RepID=A0A1B3ZAI7_9SPHN|nr:ATP12 family protein [Sphingomonas panacis]AOH84441.1 ATPase [Sphingomonas panacis]
MKRFWKDVTVDAERGVRLDGKPLRTPGRAPLLLPTHALAEAVADEWRACGETIDPGAMPLTGLGNAAIDRIASDTALFAAGLAAYGESDLLCYRAEDPEELAARQAAAWEPLLDWARRRYDVHFEVVTGIMHRAQPPATLARLGEAVAARGAFELAALSPIVTISGSLIAALALIEGAASPEDVWTAAIVDEEFQADRWGRDPLAENARAVRQRDFDAGVRVLDLLRLA